MRKLFIVLFCVMVGALVAAPGLSGSSTFTYGSGNTWSNSTSFDYASPVDAPVTIGFAQSIGATDGALSTGWPTLTIGYSKLGASVTASISNTWKLKLAYGYTWADLVSFTPSVYYTAPFTTLEGDDLGAAVDVGTGSAFVKGLSISLGAAASGLIDVPAYSVSSAISYKLGEKVYVKPFANAGYVFGAESITADLGLKAAFCEKLDFGFDYVLFANTWTLTATVSF